MLGMLVGDFGANGARGVLSFTSKTLWWCQTIKQNMGEKHVQKYQ